MLGGITGGAIAFPGVAPTIWCGLRGLPKDVQRGVVQPFILAIQVATLVYFSRLGIFTAATITDYLVVRPRCSSEHGSVSASSTVSTMPRFAAWC